MTREELKSCETCKYLKGRTHHDMMWCRDCQQLSHYAPLPPAEGAKTCWNCGAELRYSPNGVTAYHCACGAVNPGERPQPTADGAEEIFQKHRNEPYGIFRAMEEYATLHAQRLAEKMVEEKMREELIDFAKWQDDEIKVDRTEGWLRLIDKYLKSRDNE